MVHSKEIGARSRGRYRGRSDSARRGRGGGAAALLAVAGFAGLLGVVGAGPAGASGTTLYVATAANGGSDGNDCSQAAPCATISFALTQAASGDTISVGAGTFVDSAAVPSSMTVTIEGAAIDSTTLEDPSGDANQPVLSVGSGASLSVSALTVSGGSGASEVDNDGGTLSVDGVAFGSSGLLENFTGSMSLDDSSFANDSSVTNYGTMTASGDSFTSSSAFASGGGTVTLDSSSCSGGGGIFVSGGATTISGLTVTNCQTAGGGGTLDISDSSFSGEGGGGLDGDGGALSVTTSTLSGTIVANEDGTTTIDSSTVSQTELYGGGNDAGGGPTGPVTTVITNSTLSDSDLYGVGGTTSISDSTLADGGDVDQHAGAVDLFGTIVDEQCVGTVTDEGSNLDYGDSGANSCGFSAGQNDVVEQDPQLGTLASNGGPTETEAITASSPAYHRVPVAQCPATDQRGQARPQPAGSPSCDIGAFEAVPAQQPAPTVTAVSPNTGPVSGGTSVTITGTGFVTGATVVIGQGNGSFSGAIAATNVTVVSPTEITATTGGGAKAGTFSLFVTTTGGTSAGNAGDNFTYH